MLPPAWATITARAVGDALGFAPIITGYQRRIIDGTTEHRIRLDDADGPRASVSLYGEPVERVVVRDYERDDYRSPGMLDGVGDTLGEALAVLLATPMEVA
jgi:hypothetical protein